MRGGVAELFDLTGQVAVVTGGASGIGLSITDRLLGCGANVLVVDRDETAARADVRMAETVGGRVETLVADVADVTDVPDRVVRAALDHFGRLDILVNNAGIYPHDGFLAMAEEDWDRVMNVNLKATFFLSQAALRHMLAHGVAGRIVNVASKAALRPSTGLPHYSASKAGVAMLTRSLAGEFGGEGVRVNAVAPGGVLTAGAAAAARAIEEGDPADAVTKRASSVPLGRLGDPDEIAMAVLYLACEASSYITGEVLVVDGGALAT